MLAHFGINPEISTALYQVVRMQWALVLTAALCRYEHERHVRAVAAHYREHVRRRNAA